MLAVTHANTCPTIAEDSVHFVIGCNFAGDVGHELEVVRAEGTRDPELGLGPVAPLAALGIYGDPIGMGIVDVLMGGMRIGSGDDVHPEFPAAIHHFAEAITIAEELAPIVERDLGGIEGDASATGEAGGIGVNALEVVEPEVGIVVAGIVLGEAHLGPAHRLVIPAWSGKLGGLGQGYGGRSLEEKIPSGGGHAASILCAYPDCFDVGEFADAMGAEFAAIAVMLHSTEGHARVRGHHGADEDLAGLDFVNELVLLLLVVRPHPGAGAEDG